MQLFFLLMVGHALADYPLQGDFVGKFKNRNVASPVTEKIWWHLLTAHAFIHAGFVYWLTGSFVFALVELIAHWLIDFLKCEKRIGFHADQFLHLLCKLVYCLL